MRLTILLFDGFAALGAVGCYEVLAKLSEMDIEFAATAEGDAATDTGRLGMHAYQTAGVDRHPIRAGRAWCRRRAQQAAVA